MPWNRHMTRRTHSWPTSHTQGTSTLHVHGPCVQALEKLMLQSGSGPLLAACQMTDATLSPESIVTSTSSSSDLLLSFLFTHFCSRSTKSSCSLPLQLFEFLQHVFCLFFFVIGRRDVDPFPEFVFPLILKLRYLLVLDQGTFFRSLNLAFWSKPVDPARFGIYGIRELDCSTSVL